MPTDPWCCEPTILLDNPPMTPGNMRANGVRVETRRDLIRARLGRVDGFS
jgi:hypothetical protein